MTDNLAIWNAVRTPNPEFTKAFSRGGGFKGTATNVVYLISRATELWGPIGGQWGVEVVDEQMLEGAPIVDKKTGSVIGFEKVHTIRINLRHPSGTVPGIGQTTFVGTNKHGVFTDEEAPKKSLTDAVSKAMSWLGFAADIHLGLWDDNKYVNDAKRQFRDEEIEPSGGRQQDRKQRLQIKSTTDIEHAVADGLAAQAADILSRLDPAVCKGLMDPLSNEAYDAINAAWPK